MGSHRLVQRETSLEPIRRRKIYQEVVNRLEAMIESGRFAPGDLFLSEREIMDALGVGRSAVREAMLSLERSGLIQLRSGERAQVTRPSATVLMRGLSSAARIMLSEDGGVAHLQEARTLLETGLARLAAELATDDDIARLERALKANEDAIGDFESFMRTDVEFHYAIATIPKNPIFLSFHDAVAEWLTEQRAMSGRVGSAFGDAYASHARIFAAIAGHDAAQAQAAMQEHMDQVVRHYWEVRNSAG
jgi:GntR family transcriptional regulator, sialic acid-inducible nan operon repressor